jgi:hypothetical protein
LVSSIREVFGDHLSGPAAGNIAADYVLDDALVVLALIGLLVLVNLARRRRDLWWMLLPAVIAFVGIVANGPVHGSSPESQERFVLCLVPLFLLPVRFGKERVWTATIVVSSMLAVVFQIIFNLGGWFT